MTDGDFEQTFDEAAVEAARAKAEVDAIGPRSSAVGLAADDEEGGYAVFLGVDWDADLQRVLDALDDTGEITSGSQWGLIKQDDVTLTLLIDWPDLGIEKTLYFDLDKWSAELALIDAVGVAYLYPEGASVGQKLGSAIGVDVECDLIAPALRWRANRVS